MARERKSLIETGSILPGPDILSRVIARDRDQSGRQPPPLLSNEREMLEETPPEEGDMSNSAEKSNHTTGNILSNITNNTSDSSGGHMTRQTDDKLNTRSVKRRTEPPSEPPPSLLSAAQSIRQSFISPTIRVRYNAVTFKIHPGTEEWVNEHVRTTGRMKQDVLNDALTLYRNLVEEAIHEAQSGGSEKGGGAK